MSAWTAIDNGVVAANTKSRQKYWAHWTGYCRAFDQDAYLRSCSKLQNIIIITAFAARVRTGYYGLGHQVTVQTVADALSAVSATIMLAGEQSPVYQRLIEGYRRQDPPAVPQLAVPVTVPNMCLAMGYKTTDTKKQAIGDLAIMAFYYLLRVGEYTKSTRKKQKSNSKRTIHFKVRDIGFFKNNKILSRNNPLHILLTADSCTLKITNQKNGAMGQTIHHNAIKHKTACPVKAIARRVYHILSNGGNTSQDICDVKHNKQWTHVSANNMRTTIRAAVRKLKLHTSGITPNLVGVHSLRAGGAMALKLTGESDTTIMKQGRWTSLTFLQYIHNQIAHLSADLSSKMSVELNFTNIACIEAP
jgi:hypothetical protein